MWSKPTERCGPARFAKAVEPVRQEAEQATGLRIVYPAVARCPCRVLSPAAKTAFNFHC